MKSALVSQGRLGEQLLSLLLPSSKRMFLISRVVKANHIQMASNSGKIIVGKVSLKVAKELLNRKDEKFNFNPRGRQWGLEERPRTRGL